MKKYFYLIEENLLLSKLSKEEVNFGFSDGGFHINTFGRNNVIHFSGEICHKLEIILSGQVSVEHIDESGNLMTIAEFYDGEILGGNLLFSKAPYYPMNITAKQPTIVLAIDKKQLLRLLGTNSIFLESYMEFVADHTARLGDRIRLYVGKSIRECVMIYLNYEQQKQGSSKILLSITKKALAEQIGVSRTSLSRELAKMKKDGLILYDSKTIELL